MGKVLMKGNEVIAEVAVHAGCKYFSVIRSHRRVNLLPIWPEGQPEVGGLFLQAESEVAKNQYGIWSGRNWCPRDDIIIEPGFQLEAGRDFIPGRCRTAGPDCECCPWGSWTWQYPACAIGLFPGDKRRWPW